MSEPSDIRIGPEFLEQWNGEGFEHEWYMQELPEEIEYRRAKVAEMQEKRNEYALKMIREVEHADRVFLFCCGFISAALLFGLVWMIRAYALALRIWP